MINTNVTDSKDNRPTLKIEARALRVSRECVVCGSQILSHKNTVTTCSPTCRKRWSRATDEEKRDTVKALIESGANIYVPASLLVE
jgi:predicted nucleic acid-binding Zn ribbon protein